MEGYFCKDLFDNGTFVDSPRKVTIFIAAIQTPFARASFPSLTTHARTPSLRESGTRACERSRGNGGGLSGIARGRTIDTVIRRCFLVRVAYETADLWHRNRGNYYFCPHGVNGSRGSAVETPRRYVVLICKIYLYFRVFNAPRLIIFRVTNTRESISLVLRNTIRLIIFALRIMPRIDSLGFRLNLLAKFHVPLAYEGVVCISKRIEFPTE